MQVLELAGRYVKRKLKDRPLDKTNSRFDSYIYNIYNIYISIDSFFCCIHIMYIYIHHVCTLNRYIYMYVSQIIYIYIYTHHVRISYIYIIFILRQGGKSQKLEWAVCEMQGWRAAMEAGLHA